MRCQGNGEKLRLNRERGLDVEYQTKFGEILEKEKVGQCVYQAFNNSNETIMQKQKFWMSILQEEIEEKEISDAFIRINKSCDIVKYRSFQYRLMHNQVICNDRLVHMGLASTNRCTFCKQEK